MIGRMSTIKARETLYGEGAVGRMILSFVFEIGCNLNEQIDVCRDLSSFVCHCDR